MHPPVPLIEMQLQVTKRFYICYKINIDEDFDLALRTNIFGAVLGF